MTPEYLFELEKWLFAAILIELAICVGIVVAIELTGAMNPSPEVIYYFQNCNNLTLYPQGCQVLS